jgi:hypothetical protein
MPVGPHTLHMENKPLGHQECILFEMLEQSSL